MKKLISIMASLAIIFSLCSCGKTESSTENTASSQINYQYLSVQECADTLRGLDSYYDGISQKCLDFFMQEKDANIDQYIEYSAEQARDFSDDEKALLDKTIKAIETKLDNAGMHIPEIGTISFAKTTMKEASGAGGYTHGTTIFLAESALTMWLADEDTYADSAEELVAHEIFHCLSRNNADFRKAMYAIISFTIADNEFNIPESVHAQMISNPDVERHDSYATFTINGEKKDCYLVFLSSNTFENPGDSFFDSMYTGLVDITDGTLYSYTDASDFNDVMGENTDYCEDPEECMATNFSYAVVFGTDGKDGQGYKTPEIIQKITDYLAA